MTHAANPAVARRSATRSRGSILVGSVILSLLLTAFTAALVSTAYYRYAAERGRSDEAQAAVIAESGLDVALFELQSDEDFTADAIGECTGDLAGGDYVVTIDPAYTGPDTYTLVSTGRFGTRTQAIEMSVVAEVESAPGFIGLSNVKLSGNGIGGIDSYDSDDGTYASQVVGGHARAAVGLVSNGDIETSGSGTIWGDATPGPAGTFSGSFTVSGSTAPSSTLYTPAPYVYTPPGVALTAWSGAGTLTSGTHHYTQLTVSGGKTLTVSGNVTLYVDGKFTISSSTLLITPGSQIEIHQGVGDVTISGGGMVNLSQKPSNVRFYSASTSKISNSGGSDTYAVIHAPYADFVQNGGGSSFLGSVMAATITLSGGGWLHFDEALSGGGGEEFRVIAMRSR